MYLLEKVKFIMSGIESKITRHAKGQNHLTYNKKKN